MKRLFRAYQVLREFFKTNLGICSWGEPPFLPPTSSPKSSFQFVKNLWLQHHWHESRCTCGPCGNRQNGDHQGSCGLVDGCWLERSFGSHFLFINVGKSIWSIHIYYAIQSTYLFLKIFKWYGLSIQSYIYNIYIYKLFWFWAYLDFGKGGFWSGCDRLRYIWTQTWRCVCVDRIQIWSKLCMFYSG